MSEPKFLMIPYVRKNYTAIDISNFLWEKSIAEVSSITLVPVSELSSILNVESNNEFNTAYLTVDHWMDSSKPIIHKLEHEGGEYFDMPNKDTWHLKINNLIPENKAEYLGPNTKFLPRPKIFYDQLK